MKKLCLVLAVILAFSFHEPAADAALPLVPAALLAARAVGAAYVRRQATRKTVDALLQMHKRNLQTAEKKLQEMQRSTLYNGAQAQKLKDEIAGAKSMIPDLTRRLSTWDPRGLY